MASAPTMLAKHPPLFALRILCTRLRIFWKTKCGAADLVQAATSNHELQKIYSQLLGAVRRLMDACESSGDIYPGTDPEDILMLMGLLCRIPPNEARDGRLGTLLKVVFRGLGAKDVLPH